MEKMFREFIYIFSVVNVFFVFNTVVEYKRDAQISKKRNIMVQLFMILVAYVLAREIGIWEIYINSLNIFSTNYHRLSARRIFL